MTKHLSLLRSCTSPIGPHAAGYRRRAVYLVAACVCSCLPSRGAELESSGQIVFRAGESGYDTFRIPAIVRTPSGALLAFAEGRVNSRADHGDLDIVSRRSEDNGLTWGPLKLVRSDGVHQVGNPCPVVDNETGKILLLHNTSRNSEREVLSGIGAREVFLIESDDEGVTWGVPRNISASTKRVNWRWYATGPCSGIQLRSGTHAGRLVLPANHSVHFPDRDQWEYRCHSLYSDDNGTTWNIGASSSVGGNETQIAEASRDLLIQDVRMQTDRLGSRAVRFSSNGGSSWTPLQHDKQRPCPKCQGSLIAAPTGTAAQSRLFSSNPRGPGRTHLTVYASDNSGTRWKPIKTLHDGPSAYSNLVITDDGNLACLFEGGETSPYETIRFEVVGSVDKL
ncbi:MAG: sialidase family protein [Planctomycetota bacterium]